jgi:hypothetical protein
MRDRSFYINSIKMDLFRVVTATGDILKPASVESAKEFLEHSIKDFDKFENVSHDTVIKQELQRSLKEIFKLQDPRHRLIWVENVLTARCRLY